jgi:hypothetical protein
MRTQIKRALGIALAITGCLTAACVPMSSTYERIDAPDAVRFKSICRGTVGPPSTVYYPYHGIYISLNFSSTSFGLHIPEGMTVQLNDNTIKVNGVSKSGPVQKTVHFKAFPQGAGGNDDPPEFAVRAPYIPPDTLGPFEGRSVGNRYLYYFFMGVDDDHANRMVALPFDLLEGTIELPAISINGQRFERQTLPFKQTSYFEISPVNC